MGGTMTDDTIAHVQAREVLDSRGNPTVEVEVHCRGGARGRAIVPSGASTGRHEALELRDGDQKRYGGKGVKKAVGHVRDLLAVNVVGKPASAQEDIDRHLLKLDGTPDKSGLGANAILGVSLACAHAAAAARGQPLWRYLDRDNQARMPMPMVNMISGGLHAGGNLELQDFLFLPLGARSFSESLEMTAAVYRALGELLRNAGFESSLVGDEGGYGPRLSNNEEALQFLVDAFRKIGLKAGQEAGIALDVASSHFFAEGIYRLRDGARSAQAMTELLQGWTGRYPILSIEDGLAEDDWAGWRELTEKLGKTVQLIGDDLFVTNHSRLNQGIQEQVGNSVLVKMNQVGTLTETLEVIRAARAARYRPVISARSGETEDTAIADLAVGTGVGQIKIGSIARSERLAKYNQLLRIEEEGVPYSGWVFLHQE